jgi:DNA-binding SARP family transcriptional activator/predicted ATPase/ABC-type glycerol-3-phosphate transport system substrate-binding protein
VGQRSLAEQLPGKGQALLYYLALRGEAVPRTTLAGLLWGELREEAARANLRRALVDLRQRLGDYLAIGRQAVGLAEPGRVRIDVLEFETLASEDELERWVEAVELYRGEFLDGFYVRGAPDFEHWQGAERERLQEQVIRVYGRLADRYEQAGELEEAIATVRRQLGLAPWREDGQRRLMRLLAETGQRAAALAQYETCRAVLVEELGIEPGPETEALVERIRAGALGREVKSTSTAEQVIGGRYEIESLVKDLVGQGSMGRVYRGRDSQSGATVAIKALSPALVAGSPEMVERFVREGETLRQLDHPNIVKLLDAVEEDGQHYLVLEYVGGGSLQAVLAEQGPLAVEPVLELGLGLTDALTRAHQLNIIHRDLKPSNVLRTERGQPRLTDFGIAHVGDSPRLTKTGTVLGTIDYLSPEGCNGEKLDSQADIWSLGVLLYEMLAGQRPFQGETLAGTITAILTKPVPDLGKLRPEVPGQLVGLIERMLAKDPGQRLATMRQVGAELEAILLGQTYQAPVRAEPMVNQDKPLAGPAHNLPPQPGPLIGREQELAEIEDMLASPDCRLLTIVGPGGIGKTRLAVEAARKQLGRFDNGVYFVSLAALDNPDDIIQRIAFILRPEMPDHAFAVDSFLNDLRQRDPDMLLVLDNLEQLLPAGIEPLQELLHQAPRLKLVVTSREALSLRWEWRYELAGLPYPPPEAAENLQSYSAVELLLQLARRNRFRPQLADDEMRAATRICRLLGGMPLGIELAAAQAGRLSFVMVAAMLAQSLDALVVSPRDLPARHRSLRAIFDASWQSLAPQTQQAFRRLSVFRGSFTAKAALAVAGASLAMLINLVDKSLVRQTSSARYDIHPVLQHFTTEKLKEVPDERAEMLKNHQDFYVLFLENQSQTLSRGQAAAAVQAEIRAEEDNIWAVLRRSESQGKLSYMATLLDHIQMVTIHAEYFLPVLGSFTDLYLEQFLALLETRSNPDYGLIDICWLGVTADHLMDLSGALADQTTQHFPLLIDQLMIDGRLVGMPRQADLPLLCYRTDLLAKYGFAGPPATWDELEQMAAEIQAGERATGRPDFWGYLWQGHHSETLTCNALEWQASHGGGQLIAADGTINVNNSRTRMAFERAAGWVGTISPPAVVQFGEQHCLPIWGAGLAAFVRLFPSMLFVDQFSPASTISREVTEQTGVTILPAAEGGHAATLGGWAATVVNFARHPEEAITLVRHTTSYETQLRRALQPFPLPPSIPALYDHPQVRTKHPYLAEVRRLIENGLVLRPSKVCGRLYPQVSKAYSTAVHSILTGQVDAATAVANLEAELVAITGFPTGHPT